MNNDPSDANDADPPMRECRRCGRELQPGRGDLYAVSILAVADPWPPVYSEEDLALDTGAEIRRLIVQLSGQGKQQIQDQVYRTGRLPPLHVVLSAVDRRSYGRTIMGMTEAGQRIDGTGSSNSRLAIDLACLLGSEEDEHADIALIVVGDRVQVLPNRLMPGDPAHAGEIGIDDPDPDGHGVLAIEVDLGGGMILLIRPGGPFRCSR